ncbi:MAG: BAX inhibitor (BI)-1/YccA family protein, partial [Bacilli bacterium]|nr:BAX inhibitor (BI)-1/YccA family protein [Bacilli bacterium]
MEEDKKTLSSAFTWLSIGLLVTFLTAFTTTLNQPLMQLVFGSLGGYSYFIFVAITLVLAIVFQVRILKMQPLTAKILYILYCALTGLTLAGI